VLPQLKRKTAGHLYGLTNLIHRTHVQRDGGAFLLEFGDEIVGSNKGWISCLFGTASRFERRAKDNDAFLEIYQCDDLESFIHSFRRYPIPDAA